MGNVAPIAVEVDRAALLAEADAIAGAAPAAPEPGTGAALNSTQPEPQSVLPADPGERAAQLLPVVNIATLKLAQFIAPNWNVTADESKPVADSLSLVLAYWMPDTTIDPKYLALVQLGASVYALAESKRDAKTGEYLPLRVKPAQIDEQQHTPPAAQTLTL